MKRILLLLISSIILLSACYPVVPSPSLSIGTIAITSIKPTKTFTSVPDTPTTILPTATSVPPTDTHIPPSMTPVPARTNILNMSNDELTSQHESGIYLVSTDIAPGIWCPVVPESTCTWTIYYPGRNYFRYGSGRGCMTVSQVAEVVEWNSICGPWKYLRPEGYMTALTDLPLSEDDLKSTRGPGEYLVGVHISLGVWRVEGGGAGKCEWAVFDITSNSIQYGYKTPSTLIITPHAYWVRIGKDCLTLTYLHN